MADHTKIEWTEATWNPITGCSVTSPGCTNCYAMKLAGTRLRHHESRKGLTVITKAGPVWTGEVRFNERWLDQPLRWKGPRMIFVCAHGDLFHEDVPDEWIDRVFAVMALAPQHVFQVLTKRSARMREYITTIETEPHENTVRRMVAAWPSGWPIPEEYMLVNGPNIWLGVSVEDQARANERLPDLLATPASVRWLSCEPLLESVDLHRWLRGLEAGNPAECQCGHGHGFTRCPNTGSIAQHCYHLSCDCAGFRKVPGGDGLHWVVAGGESGPGARPMQLAWARVLRDQCAAAGVPFFFKQWGNHRPVDDGEAGYMVPCSKAEAGRHLDGVLHDAFPEVSA